MLNGQLIDCVVGLHWIAIVFIIIGAFWRRWFGGGFEKWLPDSRFWKYLVLTAAVFAMHWSLGILDWNAVRMYAIVGSFAYHWCRSHGDYFFVYDARKDEGRIKWIDWVLRRIYGKDNYYNFKGNVTGLVLRYTSTACLVALCLPNAWFVLAGPATALCYVVTGKMERPTNMAEYLAGAVNFGLLYWCL